MSTIFGQGKLVLFLILVSGVIGYLSDDREFLPTFTDAELIIPSNSQIQTPIDINIKFTVTRHIYPFEFIGIRLPRFTRRYEATNDTTINLGNVTISDVIISPSYFYSAAWYETPNHFGTAAEGVLPFRDSTLIVKSAVNATIEQGSTVILKVHKENGIGAICGFAASTVPSIYVSEPSDRFELFTLQDYDRNVTYYDSVLLQNITRIGNATFEKNTTSYIDIYSGLGNGCDCNGHGKCDYCYEICECDAGFGSDEDIIATSSQISAFCSHRVCPAGKAIVDIPSTSNKAHEFAECSNQGLCDRSTGECSCFAPFGGAACDKLTCPNGCSGHGYCVDMYSYSVQQQQGQPGRIDFIYGSANALSTTAWDYQTMQSCVCESSWPVGFNSGERQLSEYFGPDCSLRHCPSGDDPFTTFDEEDCFGLTQYPGEVYQVGMRGNKCHIDCANRGICDYSTGKCSCFEGSWGPGCQYIANAGNSRAGFVAAENGTFIANVRGN